MLEKDKKEAAFFFRLSSRISRINHDEGRSPAVEIRVGIQMYKVQVLATNFDNTRS